MSPMATMPPPTTRGAFWARTSIPGVYRRVAHLPPAFRPVAYRSLLAGSIDDRLPDFAECINVPFMRRFKHKVITHAGFGEEIQLSGIIRIPHERGMVTNWGSKEFNPQILVRRGQQRPVARF